MIQDKPGLLPPGSTVMKFQIRTDVEPGQAVLHTLPASTRAKAIEVADESSCTSVNTIEVLMIPGSGLDDSPSSELARNWVASLLPESSRSAMPVVLQGVMIYWSPQRMSVIAPLERLNSLRGAMIEFCYFERELRTMEDDITARWPQLEMDTPLAFEFVEKAVSEKRDLMRRFQDVIRIRAQLARLAPHIECPSVYPPTLVSQVGERLREKARLSERLQFVREQVDVFEKVYEMCGQRVSDFMSSRTGHTLESVIIILLAAETILLIVDLLSSTAS